VATVTFTILPEDYTPFGGTLTVDGKSWSLIGLSSGGTWTVDLIEGTDLPDVNNYSVTITVDGATSNVKTVTVFGVKIQPMPNYIVKDEENSFTASIIPLGTPINVKKWKWRSEGSPGSSGTNTYDVTFSKEGEKEIKVTAGTNFGDVSDTIKPTVFSLRVSTPDGKLVNISGNSITLEAETTPVLLGGVYQWSIVSGPGSGSFSNSNSKTTEFTGTRLEQVTVQVTISIDGTNSSAQEVLTVIPKPTFTVEIIKPDKSDYYLSANTPIQTPSITFQAKVKDEGGNDITSQAAILWSTQIQWDTGEGAIYYTPEVPDKPEITRGNNFNKVFTTGGILHIKVTAVIGKDIALNNKDVNIKGEDPVHPDKVELVSVDARLGEVVYKGIAMRESSWRQINEDGSVYISGNDFGIMQINRPSHQGEYDWRLIGWHWDYNIDAGKDIYKDAYKAAEKFANDPRHKDWDKGIRIEYDALCKYNRGNSINLYNHEGEINIDDVKTREDVIIGFRYACNWTPNKMIQGYTNWSLPEKNSERWLTPYSVEYHIVHQDWPK
jgi:hypothetical protein